MKTIRVSEATNTQLDWLVAKCEDHETGFDAYGVLIWRENVCDRFDPSRNAGWMQPIIEREKIATHWRITDAEGGGYWQAENLFTDTYGVIGATQLIAAARCYVMSKLGETVEVPEELT